MKADLSAHVITEVRTLRIRTRWPRLLGRNALYAEHGYGYEAMVHRLATDGGAVGWGLARGPAPKDAPDVTGRRVSDLFDPAVGVTDPSAHSLDFALHDLAGVILGIPVHRMIGQAGLTELEVYGSATYFDDITPAYAPGGVEVVLANCRYDCGLGYRAFKIKIGRGHRWMERQAGMVRDIEVTRAIRQEFPDCMLQVDANDGYDPEGFCEYFRQVADCGLFTLEEPFREERDGLKRLRELIGTLSPETTVTDGESRPDIEQLLALGAEGLLDILNVDIAGYGLTPYRALAPRALEREMRLSPHTFGLGIKTRYAAQFVAGTGGAAPLEGVIDETEGVDMSAYPFHEGVMRVPDTPGFGLGLVWGRELE